MVSKKSMSSAAQSTEFYLPATFQFSTDPGRIERFVKRVFRHRGEIGRFDLDVPHREFYIPGTPGVRPKRPAP